MYWAHYDKRSGDRSGEPWWHDHLPGLPAGTGCTELLGGSSPMIGADQFNYLMVTVPPIQSEVEQTTANMAAAELVKTNKVHNPIYRLINVIASRWAAASTAGCLRCTPPALGHSSGSLAEAVQLRQPFGWVMSPNYTTVGSTLLPVASVGVTAATQSPPARSSARPPLCPRPADVWWPGSALQAPQHGAWLRHALHPLLSARSSRWRRQSAGEGRCAAGRRGSLVADPHLCWVWAALPAGAGEVRQGQLQRQQCGVYVPA